MWSIVSSMKLLRKPSKRGEGDIERTKGSTASLKDNSKEASLSHLDSDTQVNLDPSCSTVGSGVYGNTPLNPNATGKSATLGSSGVAGSSSSNSGSKVKVERRESARLASSATKFLRSLRNHSGSGKIVASSVISADDKHPINVIALKELDIDTHSLNPGAAAVTSGGLGYSTSGHRGAGSSSGSAKLPERSQSFNEKRLLVVTQNTSSENPSSSGNTGSSGQVKVKHSRAQSFVCNNSNSRNKSGYSIYLNHHHQFQSTQQNQANLAKQQFLFEQKQNNTAPNEVSSSGQQPQRHQAGKSGKTEDKPEKSTDNSSSANDSSTETHSASATSSRAHNIQPYETIYENLEVILEEKQNQEQMTNKSNIPCNKDHTLPLGHQINQAKSKSYATENHNETKVIAENTTTERSNGTGSSSKSIAAASSSESLDVNMRITGKDRVCQTTKKYNKDSGYETNCSDYSNILLPKSSSVDSIESSRMMASMDQRYLGHPSGYGRSQNSETNHRILNTSVYGDLNVSAISDEMQTNAKKHSSSTGSSSSGVRKLRRSISEVPSERNTNLAKLQTKVGDSTARAMYTIGNGFAVWTTEKSSSSLGLNTGAAGSSQTLNQQKNVYGCRPYSQLKQLQSSHGIAPIPGGFSAAVQQASVYSTLPRNHTTTTSDGLSNYRGYHYLNTTPSHNSHQSQTVSDAYHHYHQIAAKSTPSLRNAVSHETQMQNKFYSEPTEQKETSSSTSYAPVPDSQQSNYQTVPIPTLSPARSTPNLGSSGANKQLQSRSIQQQQSQGSIPQLSVVSSHQQVNDLGKQYPPTSSSHSHQKLYNNHFGSSSCLAQQSASSALQLQQLHSNDKVFAEPGRYPSTPNLQKSDSSNVLSTSNPSESNSHSENQNVESSSGQQYSSNTSATNSNNTNNPNVGAMSTSNDANSSGAPNSVGGNWNTIDTQCMLLNNNINNNNNNNNSAPVRDSSSLKQIRYGPGHEKYPSWPIPVSSAQQIDPAGESQPIKLVVGSGSTRSKSWTEQTDYPKEKTPSYARPYMKRVNHSYTQQLKTVMEKCERIPPEAFTSQADPQLLQSVIAHANASRHSPHHHQLPHGLPKTSEGSIVPPPLLYRDLLFSQQNGHMNTNYNTHQMLQYYQSALSSKSQQTGSSGNEKEYMIPSPPERDFSEPQGTVSKPLTQEDLELYTKKYEELITQYPQSEGYHSYMSSDGSSYISSGTPFLDQLRRESENNQQFWSGDKSANGAGGGCDPNDPLFGLVGGQLAAAVSGRESVTTVVTNSSSNSSGTETLKWHGSTSDISLSSGVGGNTGSINNFKSNSHNHNSARKSGSSSTSMLNKGWNEQQNIANSSRLSTPQKQHAGNSDAMCSHPSQQSSGVVHLRNKLEQLNGSPSLKKWQSNNGDTATEHTNSNKTCNNSNNNSSGGGGSYAPNLKKFPLNTYTRPNTLLVEKGMNSNNVSNSSSATSTPEKMAKLLQSLNAEASNTMNLKGAKSLSHSLSSPVIDTSKPPSVAERIMELEQQTHQQSSSSPSTSGTSSPKIGQGQSSDNLAFLGTTTFMKSSSLNNLQNSPGGLYIDEGNNVQSQQQQQPNEWLSSSQGGRSNTVSPRGMLSSFSSSSATKLTSDNSSCSSNTGLSYSYLDPDKKHKVADMTLKAIQKKALLSYYERHKGKCANNSSSSSVSSSDSNSGTPDVVSLEKDLCFSGKSNRLMLSLPKEHNVGSVDQHQNAGGGMLSENTSSRNSTSSSSGMNPSASSSPSLTGGYRAISASSSGVSSSSSTSSRINSASNPKVSSQSQHQQLLNGANHNNSPKTSQSSSTITTTGLCEEIPTQVDKSESRQSALQCSTPDVDSLQGSESARLAYMSKYLPHLVNREPASSSSSVWPSNSLPKLPQGSAERTPGSTAPVTQEPAPIPPERPPKKPHLRNLAQQAHEESNDSKPPPPLPRAPVRPPALLNNGTSKANSISSHTIANSAPPIPSKPTMSVSSGAMGVVRSPSPDELPPPPPPPTSEEMEAFLNDEPLPPPPPSVTEGDTLLGPRSRSVSGLSSCLHKDSYMAQRKERTLGYEGRYRRTLSPSGLGSNNSNAKSSPESTSLGSSDSVGSTRSVTNLATGKLDTTLSPSAWEKFHNIRPPSTTVIFTSHELSKAVGAPPATTATTSSSPHPPSSQPLFHRSISCDSNIFNNKTGASQSSIPPPVAQVAPLRGSSSTTNYNGVESAFEKCSQGAAYRNDVNVCGALRDGIPVSTSQISALSLKSCNDDNGNQLAARENLSNIIDSGSSCDRDDRYFREQLYRPPESSSNKKELDDHKEQVVPVTSVSNCRTSGISYSNSVLPSVIVPPLQYERCDKETMSNGATLLSPLYTGESHTILKKSEVSLRVNCTSDVALQTDLVNGVSQKERNRKEGKENSALTSSSESELPVATLHNPSPTPEGCPTNKGCNLSSSNNASNSTASFYTGRQKTQEELECEELSRDIAKLLPQGDKLQTLLVPLPDHKTTADYMEGLFHLELKLQPETMERRGSQGAGPVSNQEKLSVEMIQESGIIDGLKLKSQVSPVSDGVTSQNQKTASETGVKLVRTESGLGNKSTSNLSTEFSHKISRSHSHKTSDPSPAALIVSTVKDTKAGSYSSLNDADRKSSNMLTASYRRCNGHAPLPADSAYFTTSESKAKFLTQYNSDINKDPISGTDGEELDKQKEELVSRISKKLEILRTEQLVLREEIQSNEQLGQMVVERVKQTAKRNEFDKFKLHVEEIEKITSLLLGISGRLARAENALMGLSDPPNPQEKKILESKRDKLREQLDEAKILKENIDRRSAQVSSFLQKYLTVEEYADYDHFVKMKAKLIIDAREIDDKIKLGEEQLGALKDALNTTLPLSPNSSSS